MAFFVIKLVSPWIRDPTLMTWNHIGTSKYMSSKDKHLLPHHHPHPNPHPLPRPSNPHHPHPNPHPLPRPSHPHHPISANRTSAGCVETHLITQTPPLAPSLPNPYEAPSYWGYDFLPDLGPDFCSLFDLQALVTAHSLDANSPPFTQSRKAASPSNPI